MANISDKASEQLKNLTQREAWELISQIELKFGARSASLSRRAVVYISGHSVATPPLRAGRAVVYSPPVRFFANLVEEEIGFDVVLGEVPVDKRLGVLKAVRSLTGLGLKQAKDLVESIPKTVKEGVARADAEAAKKQLEDVGAKVTISKVENRNLIGESVTTEFFSLDDSETLIREIDSLLDELSGADDRIKKNQANIDSLKIETKEMLATLHAMVD
jgi:large subunit ribosomal protein L7/L12